MTVEQAQAGPMIDRSHSICWYWKDVLRNVDVRGVRIVPELRRGGTGPTCIASLLPRHYVGPDAYGPFCSKLGTISGNVGGNAAP